jgi:hypothetical protein
MLKVEKIQMKEALIISYSNTTVRGKMSLKKDYEDFEEKKNLILSKLIQDGFTNVETQSVLYITDDQLQEYLK